MAYIKETDMPMIEVLEDTKPEAIIKVIGLGGCGGNAVDHMINNEVGGVEFIAANTDVQVLKRSLAKTTLQIGRNTAGGLGAGAQPDVGRQAAMEDRDQIAEMILGADMLFITAGMGGGTGTGAAPVVAQLAREMGILTVAVVTKPFAFEGAKRVRAAQAGIEELRQHVDSLIIIPNDRLMSVLGDDVTYEEAFRASNDVLNGAVAGIAEVINCAGQVNVDFADVRTIMRENGMAMMGSAMEVGPERAQKAAQKAIQSPLLEDVHLSGARGVLVNVTSGRNMKLREVHEVMDTVRSVCAEDATIIYGSVFDDTMGDAIRVTVVATGLGQQRQAVQRPVLVEAPLARTGTDDIPSLTQPLHGTSAPLGAPDYGLYDTPPGIRNNRDKRVHDAFSRTSNFDTLDIPAFLRKQAD
jgi:cell division protein FtsZ